MPIIQSIARFLQTVQQPFHVIYNISLQKNFIQKMISPIIAEANKPADGSLDETDLKKITGYYGLAVPAVLGEAFCALRRKKMTAQERLASTCQGAMTGLFDDFFDKQRLSDKALEDLINKPDDITGTTANENLFLKFYKMALANAPLPALMQDHLSRVYLAQLLSKQQALPVLSYDILNDITIRKGAESLLFYRSVFSNPLNHKEEKMLFCLGGLMQLSNDIFDVYKDRQQGINTLVTTATKIKTLRLQYSSLLQIGIEAAFKTNYAPGNIRKFLDILSIGIFSRCYVCLDQLADTEKKYAVGFDPKLYRRTDLICDMDTAANKWKSLRYHLKLSRRFH